MNIFSDIYALNQPTIQQAYLFCLNQQFEQAKSLLDELIENQNADAMYLLALLYLEGVGIEKDISLATHWFKQAIALNHSQAMIEYACYLKEFEPEQGLEAVSLYHQAATLKHHSAYYYLGLAYLEGNILPFNINNAIKLFQHAARLEEPQSQLKLACLYLEGPAFERNIERAHAILNQFIVQYQKALLLIEPELLVKILAFNPSKSFKRNHQAFLDAQLKLQDIETEQSHQPR